jgi:hypothetical protein
VVGPLVHMDIDQLVEQKRSVMRASREKFIQEQDEYAWECLRRGLSRAQIGALNIVYQGYLSPYTPRFVARVRGEVIHIESACKNTFRSWSIRRSPDIELTSLTDSGLFDKILEAVVLAEDRKVRNR